MRSNPSYWEKTFHGLGTPSPQSPAAPQPPPPPDRVLRTCRGFPASAGATSAQNAGVRDQP
ncbi:hypothetical protein GS482_12565 [Rhodococcus hoagii]|nr:hypothetical protein [Prescottella equi]